MRLLLVVVLAMIAAGLAGLWLVLAPASVERASGLAPQPVALARDDGRAVETARVLLPLHDTTSAEQRADEVAPAPEAPSEPVELDAADPVPSVPGRLVVSGRVVDGAGSPLAGASVSALLAAGSDTAPLGQAVSGLDGRFRIEASDPLALRRSLRRARIDGDRRRGLSSTIHPGRGFPPLPPLGSSSEDRHPAIQVIAERPGYQLGQARQDLSRAADWSIEVELVLRPGSTLTGYVVSWDQPVADAEVFLVDDDFAVLDRTLSTPEGWWILAVPERSIPRVFARKTNRGTGFVEEPDLLAVRLWSHSVELLGAGKIRGRVVYPDGNAAEGVLLAFEHEQLCLERDVGEARRIAFEQDRGLSSARVLSQPDGTFDVNGLQPDRYRITFAALGAAGPQPAELFSAAFGAVDLVYAAHRLRVVIEGLDIDVSEARVSCAPLERDAEGNLVPGVDHSAEGLSGRLFAVEPGRDYVVRASAPGAYALETIVQVPWQPYETQVAFDLFAQDAGAELVERVLRRMHSGRVLVDARGPAGERAGGWTASLTSVTPGLAFAELHDVALDAEGRLPEVPAGVWQLTAHPAPDTQGWILPVIAPVEVVVRSGADSRVEVRAAVGGRLRLALAAELQAGSARIDPSDPVGPLLRHGLGASVRRADDERGAWTPLVFFAPDEVSASDGQRLLPGHEASCDPALAPGAWLLRIESRGGLSREQRVEVIARESTRVTVAP